MARLSEQDFPLLRVTSPDDRFFDRFYEFMHEFAEEVTEEKEWYATCLRETYEKKTFSNPYILIVIRGTPRDTILGYISGNYIPLRRHRSKESNLSFSGIGHMMVRKEYRMNPKLHFGTRLLEAFEEACNNYATERGEKYLGAMGEVEDRAVRFFSKRRFLWPRSTYYAQPPLVFSPEGRKCFYEVPENLMLRLTSKETAISSALLKDMVYSMYYYWIMEKEEKYMGPISAKRANRIRGYLFGKVFRDFCNSVDRASVNRAVPLVHPGPSAILAQDRETGITIRKLLKNDLDAGNPSIKRLLEINPWLRTTIDSHLASVYDDRIQPKAFVFIDSSRKLVAAGVIEFPRARRSKARGALTVAFDAPRSARRVYSPVKRRAFEILARMGYHVTKTTLKNAVASLSLVLGARNSDCDDPSVARASSVFEADFGS